MPLVKLTTGTRQVSHPSRPGLLQPGEQVEASDLWVRQHTALVRLGEIEVVEVEVEEKPKAKKKKSDE